MATHSSILAWKISWTEEPGELQFMGSKRVGHDWTTNTLLCYMNYLNGDVQICAFYSSRLFLYASSVQFSHSVMSDSMWPHRWQPTRLPHPWDSLGKNIGVGCHFLLQCMKVKSESEVPQSCPTLRDPMDCSLPGSSAHGIFQARVLEWGCHCLLLHSSY